MKKNNREAGCPKLLVIDNYDSFTYNLVQMFTGFDLDIRVHRADKITLDQARDLAPDYLLVSPGPKDPAHAGISKEIIAGFRESIPILGVCLGMQCINEVFGGTTSRAPVPVHGKTSQILHQGEGVFAGMPSPFPAARYHSLMIRINSSELKVTATADEVIMGIEAKGAPVFGVQFHPESFLTQKGSILIKNFLATGPLK